MNNAVFLLALHHVAMSAIDNCGNRSTSTPQLHQATGSLGQFLQPRNAQSSTQFLQPRHAQASIEGHSPSAVGTGPLDGPGVRPHLLLVLLDDVGWGDVKGFNGVKDDQFPVTPTFDRLMREGVKLTNLYVMPMCSPTRAAIMTGRYNAAPFFPASYLGCAFISQISISVRRASLRAAHHATHVFTNYRTNSGR